MESQCEGIAQKLDQLSPESAPHVCVSGFRYCSPRPGEMIKQYKGAEKIILFLNTLSIVAAPVVPLLRCLQVAEQSKQLRLPR